jgi:prevent-host-death family protein
MKRTASVVEVKARLSEYLRLVKAGAELVVTERGVPIARMVPLDDAERKSTRRLRLARTGLVRPGRGRLPKLLQTPPQGEPAGGGVLHALLAERGDTTVDR